MTAVAKQANLGTAGGWQITAHRAGYPPVDITWFRDQPTQISDLTFTDPYGPKNCSLMFPAITFMDRRGEGDLFWCKHDVDIDVLWVGNYPEFYPFNEFRWTGYMTGPSFSQEGTSFDCIGSLLQHDNELAKPLYPTNPIPYEVAILNALSTANRPWLHTNAPIIRWPAWWTKTYAPTAGQAAYLVPTGVSTGDNWTGLVTRSTGSFEPVLTSYINTLLTAMYTSKGRWTIDVLSGRVPTLFHRDIQMQPTMDTVVLDPVDPGVKVEVAEDWSQTGNAFYAQGTSAAGIGFTGAIYGPDGAIIGYQPAASRRATYPVGSDDGWFDSTVMRREIQLQVTTGLNQEQMNEVGQAHLALFNDPGVTGTITLTSDPMIADGEVISRYLIRAGMTIQLRRYNGLPEGIMLHVTQSVHDMIGGTNTLTVDSKFRDSLTVAEVMQRGKDSLSIVRQLVAGQYNPPVPDEILPWNYADGSGYIPSGGGFSSVPLFNGMPEDTQFPWTSWTTQRPPKAASWKDSYIHIGPANVHNATANWATTPLKTGIGYGYPIKMAQAGTVAALYIAAYDRNGNVLPVPFHVSFYYANSVSSESMPEIISADLSSIPAGYHYAVGQNYPYTPEGWENYNPDGTEVDRRTGSAAVADSGTVRVLGTYYSKAGYYPGDASVSGDEPTGLLVDTSTWQFDVTQFSAQSFDPYSIENDKKNTLLGYIYAMFYCDAQGSEDVYFLGRIFIQPPGASTV